MAGPRPASQAPRPLRPLARCPPPPGRPKGTRLKSPGAVTHPAQVSGRAGSEPHPPDSTPPPPGRATRPGGCGARPAPGAAAERALHTPGRGAERRPDPAQPTMPCEGSPSSGFRSTTLAAPAQARPRPASRRTPLRLASRSASSTLSPLIGSLPLVTGESASSGFRPRSHWAP